MERLPLVYVSKIAVVNIPIAFVRISSHLVLAIHAYMPELTVSLTKYYRNTVNMVNGIIKSYMCIKHLNK